MFESQSRVLCECSFTNKPFDVPDGERKSDWAAMPPGHFIAGKSSRLKQFALTPEQLHQREVCPPPALAARPSLLHHVQPVPLPQVVILVAVRRYMLSH